jgi:hypothetical protein
MLRQYVTQTAQACDTKEKELAKVQRSIDRCLSFIIDGDGPMDAVREKLRQLELTKSTIKKSMEQDLQPNNIEMHPNIGQLYQRKVSEISHLLSDQASREEAISLIRSLIERIDITPGEKRGQPQVQLVGGLAAILEFAAAKQQKPPSHQIAVLVGSSWLRGQDLNLRIPCYAPNQFNVISVAAFSASNV